MSNAVIEKIQKLLNKSKEENNNNEHEREQCLDLALNLMIANSLDFEDINPSVEPKNFKPDVVQQSFTDLKTRSTFLSWLVEGVNLLTNTKAFTSNYLGDRYYVLYGTEENIIIAYQLIKYLESSIEAESKRHKEVTDRRSFKIGASEIVLERCQQLTTKMITMVNKGSKVNDSHTDLDSYYEDEEDNEYTPKQCNQIMVINNALAEANVAFGKSLGLKQGGYSTYRAPKSDNAYSQGKAYGNSLNLDKSSAAKRITVR